MSVELQSFDIFCLSYSVKRKNEINDTKSKVKMKYFQFSTRWNQAEFMILLCLQAVSIQSWLL